MVDCRPAAGAAPHELAHAAPNGVAPETHHNQQTPVNNEMGGHGVTSPTSARASTPATSNAITTYTGGMTPSPGVFAGGPCAPYVCGVKSLVWMAGAEPPPLPPPPPPAPPHGVNPHVFKSVQANGADLPMNDIPTLRYYFNLGVECMWAAYGPPPPQPPPRHYSPRDLAQDMQQMGLQERAGPADGKPRPGERPGGQGKGTQRPLLGPRFKRGGNNQDNNQNQNNHNHNHNQNKGHNNNMGNKGPNNRRSSQPDARSGYAGAGAGAGAGAEAEAEAPLLGVPYIPYPPPLYPIPYYPVESDPAMMGMMSGMGYVNYDEGVEYGAPLQYYPHPPPHYAPAHLPHPPPPPHPPHPLPHPHPHPHHAHHQEHK